MRSDGEVREKECLLDGVLTGIFLNLPSQMDLPRLLELL